MKSTNTIDAARRNLVRRINRKLALSGRFLVAKRSRGVRSYCIAVGDPMTARYEVIDAPVDVEAEAVRLGIVDTSRAA